MVFTLQDKLQITFGVRQKSLSEVILWQLFQQIDKIGLKSLYQLNSQVINRNQKQFQFQFIPIQFYPLSRQKITSKHYQLTFQYFSAKSPISQRNKSNRVYPSPLLCQTDLKITPLAQFSLPICNLLQFFGMRLLKQHEIKLQQLKLLQTHGHSLAEYAETKRQPEIIKKSLNMLSLKSKGKLKIKWIKNTGNSYNSSLIAFVHVLLHRTYSIKIQQNYLTLIKSAFYNPQLDLVNLKNQQMAYLSNNQMKKLLVQFFYLLSYSSLDDKIEEKLSKYPIIMNIFIIFLRKILTKLNLEGANDLSQVLQTANIYNRLSQYFRLNYQVHENCFIFPELSMIVMHHQHNQYHLGTFTVEEESPCNKRNQGAKSSIGTMDHSPKSKQSLDSPTNTQKMIFFPKKSMKNNQQKLLKDSIKTFESSNELNRSQIRKAKSAKEIADLIQNGHQSRRILKNISSLNLKQTFGSCNCQVRKASNMTIMSNLYQFSIKFIKKSSQDSNPACYTSSKGFNWQIFEHKNNEYHIKKTQFVYKKRFETEQLHKPIQSNHFFKKTILPQNQRCPSFLVKPIHHPSMFYKSSQWLPMDFFEKNIKIRLNSGSN